MKVLIVNTLYPPHRVGGAEKSVSLLAEGLVRAGNQVAVASLDSIAQPERNEAKGGVQHHRLRLYNIYWPFGSADRTRSAADRLRWHARNAWNMRTARQLDVVIETERPDVVHCNNLTGFSTAAWKVVKDRRLPLVQTLRDYWPICTRSSVFRNGAECRGQCLDCRALTLPARLLSSKVDQLVSNSNYVIRRHHEQGYFSGVPARRIFNIVDTPQAAPSDADGSADRDHLVFGFIGRIEQEKGIEIVLKATKLLTLPHWRLRIAGAGDRTYLARLQAKYDDSRIEWLGYADTNSFFRSINVALIASIWAEPLPRTLIEAIGHGKGAICSSAGGIPEIAEMADPHIIYPADDVAALAHAMERALQNRTAWVKLDSSPSAAVLHSFEEDTVIQQYEEVYRLAIGV